MKYATWQFNFIDPKYGTGPEEAISGQSFTAEGAYTFGADLQEVTILGYFTGNPINLQTWHFEQVTQTEALSMVQAIYANAFVMDDGRINPNVDIEMQTKSQP